MTPDKDFLDKTEAGLVDFLRRDAAQAPEVLVHTASLFAGPAVELFFDQGGYSLPGSKIGGKSRPEESDDGRGG